MRWPCESVLPRSPMSRALSCLGLKHPPRALNSHVRFGALSDDVARNRLELARRWIAARRLRSSSRTTGDASFAPLAAHLVVTPEPEAHEREVARRLLTGEADGDASREAVVDAANRVLGQLYEPLTRWMGRDGSLAVLSRSLEQARAGHPPLAAARVLQVDINRPPHLAGVSDPAVGHDAAETRAALVSVLAAIIALLTRLIGADLVLRLLRQAWPDGRLEVAVPSPDASLTARESAPDGLSPKRDADSRVHRDD